MKSRQGLTLVSLLAASIWTAGCGPVAPVAGPETKALSADAEAGFDGPPRAVVMTATADAVILSGTAADGAMVRLATPQGRAFTAVADEKGGWTMRLPRLAGASLFGLSSQKDGRTVQAEGYVAILPAPAALVLLRAGAGASRMGPAAKTLQIEAVDVDAAGAAVISGSGPPGTLLTALLDQIPAGEASPGDSGHFTIALTRPLTGKTHAVGVRPPSGGSVGIVVDPLRPQSPTAGPYRAERLANAWRIDWITPGGGLQTTLLFDRDGAGA